MKTKVKSLKHCICLVIAALIIAVESVPANKGNKQTATIPEVRGEIVNDAEGGSKRIILVGTKWCGQGNKASNYNDLGSQKHLDSCCRDHDNCALKIHKDKQRWGVKNDAGYTVMDCDCDNNFYSCLKNLKKKGAGFYERSVGKVVGNLFFNVLGTPCVKIPSNADKNEPEIEKNEKRKNPKAPKAELVPAKSYK